MRQVLAATLLLLAGCSLGGSPAADREPLESALIVGSAQSPDPVLARVMELKARGVVEDVVVYESFPVQIRLRAPRRVIDELQAIPRAAQRAPGDGSGRR
ncbi:hypothetical protein J7373_09040 [Xanthomonas sp. A2111]|uniref:Lipoprotein n=1 Tax=Xanthomonas hawaiiensis TaxID=3003247 RepID=A0ABU2I4W8_9XANT|nr:hypothetical protein [Xanthomonas sp. A2111]MBO9828389.1 hypothetical protein [Xanthomonas sp. A2111]MDS9993136.1 hypothetical protein [Xanthomonas sp. A2111]